MPKYDPAYDETEKLLFEMEKKIVNEYKKAERDVQAKLDDYMSKFEQKDKYWRKLVDEGKKTQEEYNNWRFGQLAVGKRWENMKNTIAQEYVDTDKIAKSIINDYIPEVYATNFNYGTYEAEVGAKIDTGFTLYDRQSVERLMRDNPDMLPPPGKKVSQQIAEGKALRWNKEQIQSVMTQGILQGESIPKLANRLATEVGDKDYRAAVRNARTMTTGAQNAGRVDSYKRAEEMGIEMEQEWIATLDMRTRHTHAIMDGERQKVGDKFSNGLEFPGDPSGDPAEVYNCRCTLRGIIAGLESTAREDRSDEDLGGMTYEEWKDYHKSQLKDNENQTESEVVNGSDISNTWVRRPDEFDFEIEDVINAQGFDGLPRVVDAEEFDRYAQESNFIAQRTYSAPNQEILDAYRDQLYNGKWYVDCSTGGAAFGQGMYGFYNKGTEITDSINRGIKYYSSKYEGKSIAIETFTLDKNAKLISYNEISKIAENIPDKESVWGTMDEGVAAALKGYDGIIAKNNEVIILNRTKVIFKGE